MPNVNLCVTAIVLPIPGPTVRTRSDGKIMSYIRWRWLPLLLSALAVAVLLHSGPLTRHFHHAPDKTALMISGPRTDVGDNYYYFTLLRHASERLLPEAIRPQDPDGGDHRNFNAVADSYVAALYAGHALYRMAAALTTTSREAVLLTSILHTGLMAMGFVAFVATLLRRECRCGWFLSFVLAYAGLVFVDAFGNSAYFGRLYWADNLLTYYSNPTRMVNPTLFWTVGLAAAVFIVRWLREEKTRDFVGAVALAGLTGLFSISVGATLLLALGLAIAFDMFSNRIFRRRLLAIALAAFAGLAWSYLRLRAYSLTPLGQELRHGEFLGFAPKWQFLLLLGLIPFIWRMLGKEKVFVAALVVAAMLVGMFCESFHLGSRLWLRGAVIYAWAVAVFVTANITLGWLTSSDVVSRGRLLFKAGAAALMIVFAFQTQRPSLESWQGFVEREKWELLEWMDTYLPNGSIVASADIEDAFLLPIYTGTKPLYAMYGLTNRTRDEELRRYFYNMKLFGRDRQLLATVLSLDQEDVLEYLKRLMGSVPGPYKSDTVDAIIFLELVVYHSYVRDLSNALADPIQHQRLDRLLNSRAEDASQLSYAFDFAVVENSRVPSGFSGWAVAYGNDRYSILRNPQVREPRT